MADTSALKAKMAEAIAKQDAERGRPLTATEKLANLRDAIERDERDESDNWPKHPDGTNMTIGEMPEEDRARLKRAASDRSRAKLEGSGA